MAVFTPLVLTLLLLAAGWAGWRVQMALPAHHRTRDSVETVRLVLGMLVTFAALVLGLLTSSAKGHFDTHQSNLQAYSVDLISMDQRLREYGADAAPIRAVLRAYTAAWRCSIPGRKSPARPAIFPCLRTCPIAAVSKVRRWAQCCCRWIR